MPLQRQKHFVDGGVFHHTVQRSSIGVTDGVWGKLLALHVDFVLLIFGEVCFFVLLFDTFNCVNNSSGCKLIHRRHTLWTDRLRPLSLASSMHLSQILDLFFVVPSHPVDFTYRWS